VRISVVRRKLRRVDTALDKAIEKNEIPGAVVLARMPREGELLEHCSARGLAVVRPERLPMARETVFDLASLTKPIATATAVMLLTSDGALSLDDPVVKHLPEFGQRGKEAVTVRHLLTHSSGLRPWRPFHEPLLEKERKTGEKLLGTPAARDWVIERICGSALVHEPGSAAVYGDLDFMVLGALVERLAGRPLDAFCAERIFAPLGMRETRFVRPPAGAVALPDAERRRYAATENCHWRGRIVWGEVHDPNASAMGGVAGHAGLFAPADDVLRFAQAVLDVWHGRSDALPRELLREFTRRQDLPEKSDWALGWDTPTPGASSSGRHFSPTSIGHLGFTGTSLWIDLEREAVVVMLTNRVHLVAKRSRFELRPVVHDLVMEAFLADTAPKPKRAAGPQRVHFVAIGGTGMGSLAGLLHARGVEVTGSDEKLYPPMSTQLAEWGIAVYEGFDAAHVAEAEPELIVIGNVVQAGNPEAQAALESGVPCRSFPDALFELAIAGRHSVVVTGTHGKTTTTALLATVLAECGRDPACLVGGIAENLYGSFRDGAGPEFVVEGDEYDTAFFDKTPKFLHYGARTGILTSVEFDHADIYRDLEHVKSAFRQFVSQFPPDGALIAALDAPNVREIAAGAPCPVIGYAVAPGTEGAEWQAADMQAEPEGTRFDVLRNGERVGRARLPQWGRHNVANALAALAAAVAVGVEPEEAIAALAAFRGVRRRLELRGEARGVTVLDDFAHHPTAVRETLAAVRARYPGRRLVAVFEPRSNTSRRKVFQREYAEALAGADRVVVSVVPDAPIYSITGEVTERFSAAELAAELRERFGLPADAIDGVDAIVERLAAEAQEGDVALVMSNGAFGGIWEKLLAALGA
jgi:UDP-N-acetylmuramate: L-alanyl-gamma-D-glutamyl-meso-diaminopimelate ligase